MKRNKLGEYGESLLAKLLGYRRVPASGARWPNQEDLQDATRLAQVKTTESEEFLRQYKQLVRRAAVEGRRAAWYDVVVRPRKVYVFERRLLKVVDRGVGGDVL